MKFIKVIKADFYEDSIWKDHGKKQIWFKNRINDFWIEMCPALDLEKFNSDFRDWVSKYFFINNIRGINVKSWQDASKVLNTVGSVLLNCKYKIEDIGVNPNSDFYIDDDYNENDQNN